MVVVVDVMVVVTVVVAVVVVVIVDATDSGDVCAVVEVSFANAQKPFMQSIPAKSQSATVIQGPTSRLKLKLDKLNSYLRQTSLN